MSTTALVPVEAYLHMTEKPYGEYRDGVLYPKAMPTKLHAIIQSMLAALFVKQGIIPLSELTVRLSPTKYLIPDMAVADNFPGPYPTEAVHLCCEILSPEDRLGTMLAKCEEYHAWGVLFCWIIDPVKRAAWEYHSSGEPTREHDTLNAGTITINLAELYATLPQD